MKMKPFSEQAFKEFPNVTPWRDAAPLIGDGEINPFCGYVLILDATGGRLVAATEEDEVYDVYQLERAFIGKDDALAFAETIGQPDSILQFNMLGFKKIGTFKYTDKKGE